MRQPRILLAKTGLDGHWRGLMVVARALRDAGFEIVMLGMARADEIAQAAIEEDIDLVGLNVGGQVEGVERVLDALRAAGAEVSIIAGGTLSPEACRRLDARGVRTFPPGSGLESIVAAARELTRRKLPA
jgi:methylmalonyl-CoA mutase C-terminal domain/subunit